MSASADGKASERIAQLIRTLTEADSQLRALTQGEIDAIIDPETAAPILLGKAQEALARSEARYRDLITRAPLLVCELDVDGRVQLINEAVRSILGWDPISLEGAIFWERLVAAEDWDQVELLLATMRSRDVTGFELALLARDGTCRWVAWNSANRYEEGKLRSIVLFGADVTDRREAEEKSRRLDDAELARARAEAANKAKMEFLAVMSHELRTPLNAIGGYTEILEMGIKGPVTATQLEDLARIRRSQMHLLGLINDMMNFARLEAGRVTYQLESHNVCALLDNIEMLTNPQVRMRGLNYRVVDCDRDLQVWGDGEKIQQILINLVSNAIKFTPSGGSIEVRCERKGDQVVFQISDTGTGIPREKLREIFEPFVQVNSKFTRPQDGVGLGLAISRDLARGMGGDLTATSEVGLGSTFTLRLPVPPEGND